MFSDLPEAIDNVTHLINKIDTYDLSRDVLLPAFDIPVEFVNEKDKEDGGKRGEKRLFTTLNL